MQDITTHAATNTPAEIWIFRAAGLTIAILALWNFSKKFWKSLKTFFTFASKITQIFDAIARIERQQIASGYRSMAILQESPLPMLEFDSEGHCIWANKAYLNLAKRPFEELKHQGWENTIRAEDRERVVNEWNHAKDSKRDFECEYFIESSNGTEVAVKCRANVMFDNHNNIVGWFEILKPQA